jgi:hypothetical protein
MAFGKGNVNVQIYSTEPLPDSLAIRRDAYKDEEMQGALKNIGVVFFRDEDHADCCFDEVPTASFDGFYSQFTINKKGDVISKVLWNKECFVLWMTVDRVRRNFK